MLRPHLQHQLNILNIDIVQMNLAKACYVESNDEVLELLHLLFQELVFPLLADQVHRSKYFVRGATLGGASLREGPASLQGLGGEML